MGIGEKAIVGWREWVMLPELGVKKIKAKIDTGARTSALHSFKIETFSKSVDNAEQLWVRFWLHPIQKDEDLVNICEAPIIDQRWVTDSGGHKELRYVIETEVQLSDYSWRAEITLTNRENMKFRMLLGRTAMRKRIVVDPGRSFLHGKLKHLD